MVLSIWDNSFSAQALDRLVIIPTIPGIYSSTKCFEHQASTEYKPVLRKSRIPVHHFLLADAEPGENSWRLSRNAFPLDFPPCLERFRTSSGNYVLYCSCLCPISSAYTSLV